MYIRTKLLWMYFDPVKQIVEPQSQLNLLAIREVLNGSQD